MRIFVTGAAGRIGSVVATHLQAEGHEVVATDVIYRPGLSFQMQLADLCDRHAVYGLVEGCEAVIHLGNHPHAYATRPEQKVLAENMAMNANVYYAALDVGVRNIVGISSVQATAGHHSSHLRRSEPRACHYPYLPLDGNLPRNTGNNSYALSKSFGEQMLEVMTTEYANLAAISVRLPWVEQMRRRHNAHFLGPLQTADRRLAEGMTYIHTEDVATALRAMVEQPEAGYRQYFIAQSLLVKGMTNAEVAAKFLPDLEVRAPLDGEHGLVDLSAMQRDFNWQPANPPIEIELSADQVSADA